MATMLQVVGPIDIPFERAEGSRKRINAEHARTFWEVEEARPLARKHGCYVFALRASRGFKPWYVGRSTKGLAQECFTPHKMGKYNEVLWQGHWGRPVMFFVVPGGNKKALPHAMVGQVEKFLIQLGAAKNPDLMNRHHAKSPDWGIAGVLRGGKGKPSNASRGFKSMMGL